MQVGRPRARSRRPPCRRAGRRGPGCRRSGGRTAGAPWRTRPRGRGRPARDPLRQRRSRAGRSRGPTARWPCPARARRRAGRRRPATPSKCTSLTVSQCRPIFFSGAPNARPSASPGTTKHDRPRPPSSEVRTKRGVEVGVAGMADPRLGALERVCRGVGFVVGRRPGASSRRRRSRSCARTGSRRRAGRRTAWRAAAPPAARGAELGHGVAGERVDRDADGDRHPGRGDLLDDLEVDLVRLVGPAELLGVGQREQPGLAERAEGVERELRGWSPRPLGLGRVRAAAPWRRSRA